MEEITPDLVARVASRLYNQQPSSTEFPVHKMAEPQSHFVPDGHSANHAIPQSTSTALPSHVSTIVPGQLPVPGHLPVPGQLPVPGHLPVPGQLPVPSQLPIPGQLPYEAVHAPSALLSAAPPATFASVGSSPNINAHQASHQASQQGLKNFVSQLRQPFSAAPLAHTGQRASTFRSPFAFLGGSQPDLHIGSSRPLDVASIRKDFPILQQLVHGKPLAWLDNAATTQKPQCVIDALSNFYARDNSNIHRAAHTLAARATDAYEQSRQKVQRFIGAGSVEEIVFARGTTEAINLVTQTYGRKFLQPGDEIVLSILEHHANIVPWQMVAKERGAHLRIIPVNDQGEILLEDYQRMLGPRTKVVALTHASNSLGTILPVAEMTQMAKRYGARVLIDGAQSVSHIPIDVQSLGADFFVFSGHKIFGPTGIGALFVKQELHDIMPPWQGGGNMIRNVTFEETSYSDAPAKFEAGTPNIADAVGLGAALDYVQRLGLPNIAAYEHSLLEYATDRIRSIPGLRLIGNAREKVGVLSFVLPNKRTEDIGRFLDQEGIAVRSGHHCSQPSLRRFGLESTVRPSLSFYNTHDEIDRLVDAIRRIQLMP